MEMSNAELHVTADANKRACKEERNGMKSSTRKYNLFEEIRYLVPVAYATCLLCFY